MTEFDDFLQKTERVLEARRAAMVSVTKPISRAQATKEQPEKLQRLASLEWSKLLLSVTDQTSGKSINKDRFLAYGRTGVMLGKVILMLKPRTESEAEPKYMAEYRSSSPDGGVIKLAEVSIEPTLSRASSDKQKILWHTIGLDQNEQLATYELATILAMRLVDIYQANEI